MDLFESLNDPDTVFSLFSRRLSTMKLHELLNKIFEFVAQLKEDDLCGGDIKQLVVKKDFKKNGAPNFHLNYNVDPHLFNTQIIHEDSPNKDHDFPSPEKKIKLDTNSVVTKKKEDSARSSLQNKDVSKDIVKAVNNQKPDTEILFKKTPENPFLNPTKANLVSSFVVPTSQTHIESPKQSTLEEKNLDPYETPKFANEMPLSSSSVILELAPKLRENMQKNQQKSTKNLLSEKLSKNKPWPDFPSSFRPLPGPDFELESFKPGAVSEELASALGMTSNKDPPPYLAKLIKAGLPSYYHEEVFYGINTKIPANYNAKLWREAGVDPYYIDGDHKETNVMQDENNKSKNKSREDLTDDAYLRRYLRKPVTVYKNTDEVLDQGEKSKADTIEID